MSRNKYKILKILNKNKFWKKLTAASITLKPQVNLNKLRVLAVFPSKSRLGKNIKKE